VNERHRHRYEVNPEFVPQLEKHGMRFTGQSEDGNRMEIMELNDQPYFVSVQYHPGIFFLSSVSLCSII
jgi:CTP synthase